MKQLRPRVVKGEYRIGALGGTVTTMIIITAMRYLSKKWPWDRSIMRWTSLWTLPLWPWEIDLNCPRLVPSLWGAESLIVTTWCISYEGKGEKSHNTSCTSFVTKVQTSTLKIFTKINFSFTYDHLLCGGHSFIDIMYFKSILILKET